MGDRDAESSYLLGEGRGREDGENADLVAVGPQPGGEPDELGLGAGPDEAVGDEDDAPSVADRFAQKAPFERQGSI